MARCARGDGSLCSRGWLAALAGMARCARGTLFAYVLRLVSGRSRLAEPGAEVDEVRLHCRRVAKDEARHESEEQVADGAVLRNHEACATAFGSQLVGPRTAEWQVVRGDAQNEPPRRYRLVDSERHRSRRSVFDPAACAALERPGLDAIDARAPIRKLLVGDDRVPDRLRRLPVAGAYHCAVVRRERRAD